MLVYGDHSELADPAERLKAIGQQLASAALMPAGIERHAKLVGALIDAGELMQGIADKGWPAPELDRFVHRLARCVIGSWESNFAHVGQVPQVPQFPVPSEVELRVPEGFAFYAVYPEAYVEAARKLKLCGPPQVIAIRSIGATLGPIVAASLNARPAITVRPFGDPFARKVELPPNVVEPSAHYVIVDEGPGLSGSSFGSVADWLQARGVPLERIAFLPSHSGDLGPQASASHRERWARAQRVAATFNPLFLQHKFGPLENFTTNGPWERRKFIAGPRGKRLLLKFAGLGSIGERKLEMARALHAARFTPEPVGLVHGFLVERWCEDVHPLGPGDKPAQQIGKYIGARSRLFPAPDGSGATIEELFAMCRRNISLVLGKEAVCPLDCRDPAALAGSLRRVRTDNKLERAKWLRHGERLLKTDALDHHQAHDLIGCQTIEWDIAGAIEEFDFGAGQSTQLIDATCTNINPELLHFYRIAYAAFRLGQSKLAAKEDTASRYQRSLHHLLHQNSCPPRESAGILA